MAHPREDAQAWSRWLRATGIAEPPDEGWRDPAGLRHRFAAMGPDDQHRLLRGTFIPTMALRTPDPMRHGPLLAIATALWDVLSAHDERAVAAIMEIGRTWTPGLGEQVVAPADTGLLEHMLDGVDQHPGLVRYALLRSWIHHAGPHLSQVLGLTGWPSRPPIGSLLTADAEASPPGSIAIRLPSWGTMTIKRTRWGWMLLHPAPPVVALGAPGRFRRIADLVDRIVDLCCWPAAVGGCAALPIRWARHPQMHYALPWLARACAPSDSWRPRTSAMDEALDGAGFRRPEQPVHRREPAPVTPIHREVLRICRARERQVPFSRRIHAFWQALERPHPGIRRRLAAPATLLLEDPRFWWPGGPVDEVILDPSAALVVGGLLLHPDIRAVARLFAQGWQAACTADGLPMDPALASTLAMAARRPWPEGGYGSRWPHDLARVRLVHPRIGITLAVVFGLLDFERWHGRHVLHERLLDLTEAEAIACLRHRTGTTVALTPAMDLTAEFADLFENTAPEEIAAICTRAAELVGGRDGQTEVGTDNNPARDMVRPRDEE